jgi:hypothetical protein
MNSQQPWYKRSLPIVALLIFFFPAGLLLMWLFSNWSKRTKYVVSALVVLLLVLGAASDTTKTSQSVATTPTPPLPSTKPIDKVNIVVSSLMVKKIDGKYRYFFDIRNNDSKNFEGSVKVELINGDNRRIDSATYNTSRALEPNLGLMPYFDLHSGPTFVHGSSGISTFKYEVKVGNDVVNAGGGSITEDYEDTDL